MDSAKILFKEEMTRMSVFGSQNPGKKLTFLDILDA